MIELTTIGSTGVEVEVAPPAMVEATGGLTLWFRYKTGTPLENHSAYVFTADEAKQLLSELAAQVGDAV